MESITNWSVLWRELVEAHTDERFTDEKADPWAGRAQEFAERVKRRWNKPDSSRDFVLAQLDPAATVLDIGAGIGAWSLLMAQRAAHVTAVDPSPAMLSYLRADIAEQNVTNVSVIEGAWPHVDVEPHDFSLCSHAMYGVADFPGFVERMIAVTKRTCFLLMRATAPDGVMAEAAQHIWGQPFDSPSFAVAYNCLLQMGIFPNVQMENTGRWKAQTSPDFESALQGLKHHFGLMKTDQHDAYLTDLLHQRLRAEDGGYTWPREVYSALIYWSVD